MRINRRMTERERRASARLRSEADAVLLAPPVQSDQTGHGERPEGATTMQTMEEMAAWIESAGVQVFVVYDQPRGAGWCAEVRGRSENWNGHPTVFGWSSGRASMLAAVTAARKHAEAIMAATLAVHR
jgi:hypothetical protein